MVNTNYLELENIFFSYKKNNVILKNLNIKIFSGKIIALLGINGSGKTTLFKILTGIYQPDSGCIKYNEKKITENNIMTYKASLGFMPEFLYLYKNMSVREVLKLLASLKGYDNFDIDSVLKTVFLLDHCEKKIKILSKGMKQRLNLAQAIIGNPKVILFDEPSNGFDCGSIMMFYAVLKQLAAMGTIILISSHHITEIYGNVDEVLILSNGTIIKTINIASLTTDTIALHKDLYIKLDEQLQPYFKLAIEKQFPSIKINNNDYSLILRANTQLILSMLTYLTQLNIKINDIRINDKILEDILTSLS